MSRHPDFVPQGVIPAVLLPFREDLSIDEPSFPSSLARCRGGAGIVCDHDQRSLY
jgi:dihydrodipicolinate synthase/N-acetylneuraminate lyase